MVQNKHDKENDFSFKTECSLNYPSGRDFLIKRAHLSNYFNGIPW